MALARYVRHILVPRDWTESFTELLNVAYFLVSLPFVTTKEGHLAVTRKSWRIAFLWGMLIVSTIDSFYRAVVCGKVNYKEMKSKDIMQMYIELFSRSGATILSWDIFVKMETHANFVNHIFNMNGRLAAPSVFYQTRAATWRGMRGMDIYIFVACGPVSYVFPLVGSIGAHLQDRHSPRYWGAMLLPRWMYDSLFGTISYATFELFVVYSNGYSVFFIMSVGIAFNYSTDRRLELYQGLEILNNVASVCYSRVLWPAGQNTILICHVTINVILISMHDAIPLGLLGMLITTLVMLLLFERNCIKACAEMYEESRKFKRLIAARGHLRQRKVARSLRPLKVFVGSYYYFKMSTFMTYVNTVVDYTIDFLIAIIEVADYFPEADIVFNVTNSSLAYQLITGNSDIAIGYLYHVLPRLRFGNPIVPFYTEEIYALFQQPHNLMEQRNVFTKPFKPDLAIGMAVLFIAIGTLVELSETMKTDLIRSLLTLAKGCGWAAAIVARQGATQDWTMRRDYIKFMLLLGMMLSFALNGYYSAAILSYFRTDEEIIRKFSHLVPAGFSIDAFTSVKSTFPETRKMLEFIDYFPRSRLYDVCPASL
ncbi:hypothetical protein Fcan01_00580 [Folsomia candida]|uniref:Uncharacterized protein n=1 Tax=Folsomia candida TaxID=158441 RepID=A0A226F543_FOLCA|nr:hypothetical protein Fcan01_00580 [Folsomia candida]